MPPYDVPGEGSDDWMEGEFELLTERLELQKGMTRFRSGYHHAGVALFAEDVPCNRTSGGFTASRPVQVSGSLASLSRIWVRIGGNKDSWSAASGVKYSALTTSLPSTTMVGAVLHSSANNSSRSRLDSQT